MITEELEKIKTIFGFGHEVNSEDIFDHLEARAMLDEKYFKALATIIMVIMETVDVDLTAGSD